MFKISKARNRKGFTLIELMIVIAIIIILAAIAIPNYLRMTERAKKSRLAADMATLATGLETFRTDWGSYPVVTTAEAVSDAAGHAVINAELAGLGGTAPNTATVNIATRTNVLGESGPIEYLKPGTLNSIIDPFTTTAAAISNADGLVYYLSDDNGNHWVTFAYIRTDTAGVTFLYRTDSVSAATEILTTDGVLVIDADGVVTDS
ncbi:MAG: prepilin-type N-terminal cleavage/methylation domain-containing protein [Caldisericota bacterium]|nr:prepilin-type N-terminal cleavage/methylation domain-containing protein [Caldisericota bacterium]